MMKKLFILLAFLAPLAAFADTTINGPVTFSGFDVRGSKVTADFTPSGGTVASTVPALAGRVLTPYDFGAVGDTQRKSCTVTTASASPTVTITSCAFTAADIGKLIVIFDAGSTATTPLASTINNVSGTTLTLADNAGQAITTTAKYVTWGHDDSAAINAAIAATAMSAVNQDGTGWVAGNVATCVWLPPAPGGFWGVASQIELNPSGKASCLRGTGRAQSQIVALATLAQVLHTGTTFVRGGTFKDFTADGNKIATSVLNMASCEEAVFDDVSFNTGKTGGQNINLGDGSSAGNTCRFINDHAYNAAFLYSGLSELPSYGALINQTDSQWTNFEVDGASVAKMQVAATAFNTEIVKPHLYGSTYGTSGITVLASAQIIAPVLDHVGTYAIDINASEVQVIGGYTEIIQNAATAIGVHVGSASFGVIINGFRASGITTAANKVVVDAGATGIETYGNLFAVDVNPLPIHPLTDPTSLFTGTLAGNAATGAALGSTGFGYRALANSNAVGGAAFGTSACEFATGANDTCFGPFAGRYISTGLSETFFGDATGEGIVGAPLTGNGNSGFGRAALTLIQGTASFNTAFGVNAGAKITTGARNLVLGPNVASTTLANGTDNVLIGTTTDIDTDIAGRAGTIQVGSGSTAIWSVTGTTTPTTAIETFHGNILLPEVTTGTNADFVCMSSGNKLTLQTSACTISSMRFKNLLGDYRAGGALATVAGLKPIVFRMKPQEQPNRDPNFDKPQIGLSAENVAAIEPRCAIYENDGKTPKSYRQECLIAVLIAGMQAQQREIAALRAR